MHAHGPEPSLGKTSRLSQVACLMYLPAGQTVRRWGADGLQPPCRFLPAVVPSVHRCLPGSPASTVYFRAEHTLPLRLQHLEGRASLRVDDPSGRRGRTGALLPCVRDVNRHAEFHGSPPRHACKGMEAGVSASGPHVVPRSAWVASPLLYLEANAHEMLSISG